MKSLLLFIDRVLRRFTPDPFVIAILLTVLTIAWATWKTENTALQVVHIWGGSFWNLLEFTLQMAMILLGGFVVAVSPPVKKLLLFLISFIETPTTAIVFCCLSACVASYVNWGFGLVVGGIVALEVGKKVTNAPFRLLVASSYSGFLVWHAGLSGSIPITLNTENNKWQDQVGGLVPLQETLFSSINIIALVAMLVLLPLLHLAYLKVLGDEKKELEVKQDEVEPTTQEPQFLERNLFVALLLVGLGGTYLFTLYDAGQFKLDLNSINFVFFMVGVLLHGSPGAFMSSVKEAIPKIAPILIQYPLYAAIMGVLSGTGLGAIIAEWFVAHSTEQTFPLMTFYSAGLLNLFVPSGGGQWAVQAPIVMQAASELGADVPKTIMAVAWGDAWTNLAQPFWAMPLLAIAGLNIKDIIGFCLITLLASGLVLSLIFLLL